MGVYALDKLIEETRRLACEYRRTTGKPLPGVTSEIANFDAMRLLKLVASDEPDGGFDAVGAEGPLEGQRVQIKGRALFESQKGNQRIGQIKADKPWDCLVLVLLDDEYQPSEIFAAERVTLLEELEQESDKRKKRGALSVAKFRHLSDLIWTAQDGLLTDGLWSNRDQPDE